MAAPKKKPHEKVMEFVERELKKNPKIGSSDLFKKAKKVSRTVSGMTIQQFHAKYPLQVKRRLAPRKPRKSSARQPRKSRASKPVSRRRRRAATKAVENAVGNRDAIRVVLLSFAKDLSAAESKAATIDVLADLDKYVDRVVKAAG